MRSANWCRDTRSLFRGRDAACGPRSAGDAAADAFRPRCGIGRQSCPGRLGRIGQPGVRFTRLAAVRAGAAMINDVNALRSEGALPAAARLGVPVCLMHMQGEPRTMQEKPHYDDVVAEVAAFLESRIAACVAAGIREDLIVVDPGFGFGKTVEHNLSLLRHLDRLVALGYPVLVGLSRKSLIGKVLGLPVDKRLYPSIALAVLAVWQGASIVRCHDVRQTREAVQMCKAVQAVDYH